jgi:hypothetical protein
MKTKKMNWLDRALKTFMVDCDEYSYLLRDCMSPNPENWERASVRESITHTWSPGRYNAKCNRRLTFTTMNIPQFRKEDWEIPF